MQLLVLFLTKVFATPPALLPQTTPGPSLDEWGREAEPTRKNMRILANVICSQSLESSSDLTNPGRMLLPSWRRRWCVGRRRGTRRRSPRRGGCRARRRRPSSTTHRPRTARAAPARPSAASCNRQREIHIYKLGERFFFIDLIRVCKSFIISFIWNMDLN